MPKEIGNFRGNAIETQSLNVGGGSAVWNLFTQLFFKKRDIWPSTIPPFSATGGNQTPSSGIQPGNGYTYWTFTSPGTFTVTGVANVEVFMVGGGGNGTGCAGGGGGAGAIFYATNVPVTSGPYSITVGVNPQAPYSPYVGAKWPSTALGYTAAGGGPGGGHDFTPTSVDGQPGGSGGGDAGNRNGGGYGGVAGTGTGSSGGTPGATSPPAGWGNPGGKGPDNNNGPGGSGGGAGGAGSGTTGGAGLVYSNFAGPLIGFPTIPSTFAVGGNGSGDMTPITPHPAPGTGSGGRSGGYCASNGQWGAPGIVIIRKSVV